MFYFRSQNNNKHRGIHFANASSRPDADKLFNDGREEEVSDDTVSESASSDGDHEPLVAIGLAAASSTSASQQTASFNKYEEEHFSLKGMPARYCRLCHTCHLMSFHINFSFRVSSASISAAVDCCKVHALLRTNTLLRGRKTCEHKD
jgi:hypothetical protein